MGKKSSSEPKRLRQCDECGDWFSEKTMMFDLVMRLQAEVPEVLDLDDIGDDALSPIEEMERIIKALDQLTPAQAAEAEAAVFEEFRFLVCPACRHNMTLKLRRRRVDKGMREHGIQQGADGIEETVEDIAIEEIKMPDVEASNKGGSQGEPFGSKDGFSSRGRFYQRDPETDPL